MAEDQASGHRDHRGEALDPRRVQHGLVCMLFDPKYAAKVRRGPVPELGERERELLRQVDHRALASDTMRRARALQVILDEYPVSAAVLGVDTIDRYFASPAFRSCVFERGSMALSFGERYLGNRARGVGSIETALARARREADTRRERAATSPIGDALRRAPGVIPLSVPEGTLAWYRRARERLGPEPLRALARQRKPWSQQPPRRGTEHLLIEPQLDGSLGIASASAPLVELLRAAERPRARAELAAAAIELGAEHSDAEELLDELLADDLLTRH